MQEKKEAKPPLHVNISSNDKVDSSLMKRWACQVEVKQGQHHHQVKDRLSVVTDSQKRLQKSISELCQGKGALCTLP
jgi:hypothetical protein